MTDQLMFLLAEPRANHSQSQDLEKDWTTRVVTSCSHILPLLNDMLPSWIVWENVPGVLSSNGGRDFGTFLAALGQIGYGFAYRVLDAQYFGVAQRRRRVFVVGYLGDWRRAAAVLFERESLSGHPAPRREAGEKVAPTVTTGAPFSRTCRRSIYDTSCPVPYNAHWKRL
jgi:site-specific DNA-cytosine methylase